MPGKKQKQASKIPVLIKLSIRVLEILSVNLAAKFAMKLFRTPIRFKLPKREEEMNRVSTQEYVFIPAINKKIRVYILGESKNKVLLVHGWSGRGTQLYSIAQKLIKQGYSTISFDAPAHGKSTGKTSDMTEFIASVLELEKKYGPFQYAVGHSLGAMAILNAVKGGLSLKKAVTIGSGDIIKDIMDDFAEKLGMKIATCKAMVKQFEKKFNTTINSYSAYIAAREVNIPVLVIHDENDTDVPVKAAYHIKDNLPKGELMITQKLGHRKILGDKNVIKRIIEFLEE